MPCVVRDPTRYQTLKLTTGALRTSFTSTVRPFGSTVSWTPVVRLAAGRRLRPALARAPRRRRPPGRAARSRLRTAAGGGSRRRGALTALVGPRRPRGSRNPRGPLGPGSVVLAMRSPRRADGLSPTTPSDKDRATDEHPREHAPAPTSASHRTRSGPLHGAPGEARAALEVDRQPEPRSADDRRRAVDHARPLTCRRSATSRPWRSASSSCSSCSGSPARA